VEIGVILLLLVPFISSKMWNKVFRSNIIRGLESQLIYYFYVLVAILILFFLDSIREMQKYSSEEQLTRRVGMSHLDTQMQMQMRLFRAQRNFYIAGFALFLLLVIKKLVSLISANAGLQAARTSAVRQAESARKAAENLMNGEDDEVKDVKKALDLAKREADAARREVVMLKKQSEHLAREYDKLVESKPKDKIDKKKSMFGWKLNN